ncbi:transketolase [Emiliania huxleyi CCMP1516]|uniref:Transketolase-like pyrimidine-binding domain-containing protein n=2 Tax=Emiliania huxleyi TaxID=2903 RepID=A0A0D3K3Z9_EMIH1|nr:transketolase [Emiliania huxleyi CCMP1516]EOD30484.1 transketolase [Emiliania huxleyi CCMP1516]|eukprot:XP_005782913.1 transketolase [Emiliania huxleyi CCMP1516]
MVQAANSGHPGAPMGCAPMAHVLWSGVMSYDPADPEWINRDRFVLSNGHACALLYSMLHLTGYGVSIDDLKQFRQLDSITPGHPENGVTPGVEVSTGPLGQGISNGVGLAMAQAHLGATFNREGFSLIDNFTYVICGDGCMQEGISSEAVVLVGHLQLGRLIVLYDDNKIQIDGATSLAFSEDVGKRYEAYGWQASAPRSAAPRHTTTHTHTPPAASGSSHLRREGDTSRVQYEWLRRITGQPLPGRPQQQPPFGRSGGAEQAVFVAADDDQSALLGEYAAAHPALAAEFERRRAGELPAGWREARRFLPAAARSKPPPPHPAAALASLEWDKPLATRQSSQLVLNKLCEVVPELVGGSADLTPSNLTKFKGAADFQAPSPHPLAPRHAASPEGRYIRFGVREHAMAALCNGMHAYGMLRPFCATFLNFFGYAAGAVRVSALSHFGEDGPTHQPVEALVNLRATPNLLTLRPADANEVVGAYMVAMERPKTPAVIALSRQGCANLAGSRAEAVARGAYDTPPQLVLVGTGSEVQTLEQAVPLLEGVRVQLVSMPCCELFDSQPREYKHEVLPPGVPVLAMEALAAEGWCKYAHSVIGMRSFGCSAPAKEVQKRFGFTADNAALRARELLQHYANKLAPDLLDRPDN